MSGKYPLEYHFYDDVETFFWCLVDSREQTAHLALCFQNIGILNGGICSGTQQSGWYPVGAGDTQKEIAVSARNGSSA